LTAHPLASDVALALFILLINLMRPGDSHDQEQIQLSLPGAVISLIACTALVLRRRFPLPVLAVTTVAAIGYAAVEGVKSPIGLALAVAAYTVVVTKDRLTRTVACVVVAIIMVAAATILTDGDLLANLSVAVLVLLAAAIGEAVRYRRAYQAEIEERLRRVELDQEEEARRRIIEERLRIAHELHDVIAHHIALMNVQAGVASHLLRDQPDEAERALALVRDGGRTVLQELTVLLGVLRRSDQSGLPTAPSPSLRQVGPLIESFASAGLQVDHQAGEPLGELPDVIELTAYRILQESLTNVVKHAPGARVRVELTRRGGELTLDVTDDGGTPVGAGGPAAGAGHGLTAGTGHGLIGMRERVAAVAGRLEAGPVDGGGFRVHAVLPLLQATVSPSEGNVDDDPGVAGRRPDPDPARVSCARRLGARPGGGG